MVVKVSFRGEEVSVAIPQSCYDRIQTIYSDFEVKCQNINEDNLDELCLESGKCRGKIDTYLLALYDIGAMDYYDNAVIRFHYSDMIHICYENALDRL